MDEKFNREIHILGGKKNHTYTQVKLKSPVNKNSTGRQNNMRERRQGSRILHVVIGKRSMTSPFVTSGSHLRDWTCKCRSVTEEGTNIQGKGIENTLNETAVQNFVTRREVTDNQVQEASRTQGRHDQRSQVPRMRHLMRNADREEQQRKQAAPEAPRYLQRDLPS